VDAVLPAAFYAALDQRLADCDRMPS